MTDSEVVELDRESCGCKSPRYKLVFSCSGAADVGALADRAARQLSEEKAASMCCAAAIAAGDPDILDTARNAVGILAIDGCPKECARLVLERAGIEKYEHLQLEKLGFAKGESPATPERCETVLRRARSLIAD